MIAPYLPGGAATVPRPCTGQILAMFAQSFRRLAVVALLGLGSIGASNAQQLVRVGSTPTGKPEHDCVRLQAPLRGITRLDAISYPSMDAPQISRDIPFDAASGEVVLVPKIERIRTMPAHQHRVRLVAVDANGEHVIGDYTFIHSPFAP